MARLAFYTFAILKEPWGHPEVQGFIDAVPGVFGEVVRTEGYITRAERPDLKQSYFGQHFGPLHDHGPSLRAFKFSTAFNADGQRIAS